MPRRVAVSLLLFAWALVAAMALGKELRHGDRVRLPDSEAGRAAAEEGINCPTMREELRPSSSIKCDGCHVLAVALTYRVVRKGELLEEATDTLCEDMMEAVLRQKTNGRRFWVPPHKSRLGDDEMATADRELESSRTITLTGMEPRFGKPPTYHDEWEQRALPCAPYMLKRLCFSRLEEHEDAVEACYAKVKKAAPNKLIRKDSDDEEALLNCFSAALGCEAGDCNERRVLKAREQERLRFVKFEGAYGNQKAPYVEDEFTPGLMEKNPYAPGGAKAHKNELLRKKNGADEDL